VKSGWWGGGIEIWLAELKEEGYLGEREARQVADWQIAFESRFEDLESVERAEARTNLTRVCELMAWEEWDAVHALLREE
jgi:hypothetical protein